MLKSAILTLSKLVPVKFIQRTRRDLMEDAEALQEPPLTRYEQYLTGTSKAQCS